MTFSGHSGKVNDIAVGVDGKHVVSCSADKSVKIFSIENGKQIASHVLSSQVTRLAVNGIADVYAGCTDGSVWVMTADSMSIQFSAYHKSAITGLGLSIDGSRLVTCAESDGVKIWDTNSRVLVQTVMGPSQQLKNSSALLMVRRPSFLGIPDTIVDRPVQYSEPSRMASAIDSYLTFKPLQRTLVSSVSMIEKIPLVKVPLSASMVKVKAGSSICIDATAVENGAVSTSAISKLTSELERQKILTQKFASMYSSIHSRLIAMRKDDESFDFMFPEIVSERVDGQVDKTGRHSTPDSQKRKRRR
jgi:hypothetical protein